MSLTWLLFFSCILVFAAPNAVYRRAILQAIENLHDFNSRSNIEDIRKHVSVTLQDGGKTYNETLFRSTLKNMVESGDIELCNKIRAELSEHLKKQRSNRVTGKLNAVVRPTV